MREYGRVAPTFWTRGSGKRLRGHPEAQLVALYLMTSPTTNMVGIFHLTLPSLCHETGLPLEGARKGLERCSEEALAYYDEDEELVWVPALARHQLGERLRCGKNGRPDNRVAALRKALAPFKGHRFYDLFLERYAEAYLLTDLLSEAPPKPLASPIARARPAPAPAPAPESGSDPEPPDKQNGSGQPVEIANLEEARNTELRDRALAVRQNPYDAQFMEPSEWDEVRAVADAYFEAAGTPNAKISQYGSDSGVRAIVERFADGYSQAELELAARRAPREPGWSRDGQRKGLAWAMAAEVVRRTLSNAPAGNSRVAEVLAEVEAEAAGGES